VGAEIAIERGSIRNFPPWESPAATAIASDKAEPLLLEAVRQSPSSRTRIMENWVPLIGAPVFLLERPRAGVR